MKRRIFTFALATLFLVVFVTGCADTANSGSQANTSATPNATKTADPVSTKGAGEGESDSGSLVTAPGEFPIVTRPTTLSIYVGTTITNMTEPQEDNWAINFFEEKTGVHLEWEIVTGASDQVAQRTNLKFASNDLPDVMAAGLTKTMQMQYGEIGAIFLLTT